MFQAVLQNCKNVIVNMERILFFGKYPPRKFTTGLKLLYEPVNKFAGSNALFFLLDLNFAEIALPNEGLPALKPFSIREFMQDGTLWAVPKNRRTIERRLRRRFGCINSFFKMQKPQTDLLVCNHCGHDYKRGFLCSE